MNVSLSPSSYVKTWYLLKPYFIHRRHIGSRTK